MAKAAKGEKTERALKFEDVWAWSEDDQLGELVEGIWTPVTRPTMLHGFVMGRITELLGSFVRAHRLGAVVCGDAGMKLTHDPDTLRGPDVAFIRAERLPQEGFADEWWEGAPDLAVEVVSKSQTAHYLGGKALDYLGAGAKMVWVADPQSRTVAVYTPPNHIRFLREDETFDGKDVLPGFQCKVGDLFA